MRCKFLLTILLAFMMKSGTARADIIFVDVNFSETEVAAARAEAKKRGEKIWVIPTDNIPAQDMERMRSLLKEQKEVARLRRAEERAKRSKAIDQELDVIRKKASEGLVDQLKVRLRESGDRAVSLILSGHSQGDNYMGDLGLITFPEVVRAFKETGKENQLVSAYLWGCYTNTRGTQPRWRQVFPNLNFIAGFDRKGPSNKNPASHKILGRLMEQESKILAEKEGKAVLGLLERINNKLHTALSALVNECSYSVLDRNYYPLGAMPEDCRSKLQVLQAQARDVYEPYLKREEGKELPPDTSSTPQRQFYDLLQRSEPCVNSCADHGELLKGRPNEEALMNASLPCKDSVIRLIRYENIVANFERRYGSRLKAVEEKLRSSQSLMEACGQFLAFTPHSAWDEFKSMESLVSCADGIDAEKGFSAEARSALMSEVTARLNLLMSLRELNQCVPFDWIEPQVNPRPMGCDLVKE